MAYTATRRLIKKIDRLVVSRAIRHAYKEVTGCEPKVHTQVQLGELFCGSEN